MRAFEESMRMRAREKAQETVSNMETFLSEDGGERMAAFFKKAGC